MSIILAYTGAILLAYEIVGEVSHLPSFAILLISHIFQLLVQSTDRLSNYSPRIVRIILRILIRVVLLPILVVAIGLAIVIIGLWIVGLVIKYMDLELNKLYRFEIKLLAKQQGKLTMRIIHAFLPNIKDEEIVSAFDKIRVPFIGFIGIILLTAGFIIQLIGFN